MNARRLFSLLLILAGCSGCLCESPASVSVESADDPEALTYTANRSLSLLSGDEPKTAAPDPEFDPFIAPPAAIEAPVIIRPAVRAVETAGPVTEPAESAESEPAEVIEPAPEPAEPLPEPVPDPKFSYTGVRCYCSTECNPCRNLESDLRFLRDKHGWTLAFEPDAVADWQILPVRPSDERIPLIEFWSDGQIVKKVVGYACSEDFCDRRAALLELCRDHPAAVKDRIEKARILNPPK